MFSVGLLIVVLGVLTLMTAGDRGTVIAAILIILIGGTFFIIGNLEWNHSERLSSAKTEWDVQPLTGGPIEVFGWLAVVLGVVIMIHAWTGIWIFDNMYL